MLCAKRTRGKLIYALVLYDDAVCGLSADPAASEMVTSVSDTVVLIQQDDVDDSGAHQLTYLLTSELSTSSRALCANAAYCYTR